jgi:hypothetical protein
MNKFFALPLALLLSLALPAKALAHCPLCVGGAGAAAALASFLGVKYGAISVLLTNCQ